MAASVRGKIHSFESFGTLDGPGIRFVVFFQGCPLRCKFCHNPDTLPADTGRTVTVEEVMSSIENCRSFFRRGGVTLSGGEPLFQPEFALELLNACKAKGFHTALDTAGSLPLEKSAPVLSAADLILLDIKSADPEIFRELTGADLSRSLATLDFCEKNGKAVWIRHVLVPGITAEKTHLEKLAELLKQYRCIQRIELLAYHKMGAEKWQKLGIPDPLASTGELTEPERNAALDFFRSSFSSAGAVPEIL